MQRAVARQNTLVRLDFRGCGLSDRSPAQGVDDYIRDIEAVVERTRLREFGLIANSTSSAQAIAFAARHPDRVTRLLLVDAFARGRDLFETPQAQALFAAASADWMLATETIGYIAFGPGRDENRLHGEYIRACVGPEVFSEEALAIAAVTDVSDLAAEVQAPTLVIKHSGFQIVTMEATRHLVAQIPNAQLAVLEGTWVDNIDEFLRRALSFFNGEAPSIQPESSITSGTAVILFADIVDSTALTERLGDAAFRAKARDLNATMREIIRDSAGSPIEGPTLGDGLLATFASAAQAIEAALACARAGNDATLPLHVGLHAGDLTREKDPDGRDNIYGGAVNVTARISGLSAPGEVLVSQTVRDLARTSAGVAFEDRGEQALKGVGEPVRVWAVASHRMENG
jgi:class 3 adenylate cyclase